MISNKQIRIMNLGDIVTPNFMKAIVAFQNLIASKTKMELSSIQKSINLLLQNNSERIDKFKLGSLTDQDFTKQMIEEFEKATSAKITVDEFNEAWNKMNPTFDEYQLRLKQAIEYNQKPNQQVIFISFTNPKDINNLITQLTENNYSHSTTKDGLTIAGIELYTTYMSQQTKVELIGSIITKLKKPQTKSIFSSELTDIKYIRCSNNIENPTLKQDLDKINQIVDAKTHELLVETISWDKDKHDLLQALSNQDSKKCFINALS